MLLTLPLETVIEIIDALSDDQRSLVSCSLSCRLLTLICQKHLFKNVILIIDTTRTPHDETLYEILYHNPQIATFFHYLSIFVGANSTVPDAMSRSIYLLSNVYELSISTFRSKPLPWSSLPTNLPTIICTFMYLVKKKITIIGISGFPLSCVSHYPNIRELTFSYYKRPSSNTGLDLVSLPPLGALCTCMGPTWPPIYLAPSLSLWRLSAYCCWVNCDQDFSVAQAVIDTVRPSLEMLDIVVGRKFVAPALLTLAADTTLFSSRIP